MTIQQAYVKNLFKTNFVILNKDLIKVFGTKRAAFLAFLNDLEHYASKHFKRDYFFIDMERFMENTGISDKTFKKYKREFVDLGVLCEVGRDEKQRKKWKFDYQILGEYTYNQICNGANKKFFDDIDTDTETPPQTQKNDEGGQNVEKQSKAILKPKETQETAQATQTPKKPYIQEQRDEYSQARLITKNLFEWRGDEVVGFTQDDFSEWLEYLRGIGFKINEISAKRHFEELLRLGENAKKAMDNAILKGLKYPTLPFENGSGGFKGNSSEAKQEKSRYYGADEENEITRAGVSLRYNPKILKSGIGNNDYDKEFWDIIKAKDSKEYAVRSPYSDFSIDREVREYINEAQKQRFEFLQRREKTIAQARLAQSTTENNSVWDRFL